MLLTIYLAEILYTYLIQAIGLAKRQNLAIWKGTAEMRMKLFKGIQSLGS